MRQPNDAAQAIPRAIGVLRHIAQSHEGLRVAELQHRMNVPRATLYRIIGALEDSEYLCQDVVSGRFQLGPGALNLGFFARRTSPLSALAMPILREVAVRSGQLCELVTVLSGWRLMALDVWHGREMPLVVSIRSGSWTALNHTYTPGAVYLAFCSAKRLEHYLALLQSTEGRRLLGVTSYDPEDLARELERWRKLGYAWIRKSGAPGVGRISAPVLSARAEPLAILGIACATRDLTPARAAVWGKLLREQAKALAQIIARERTERR